MRRTSRTSECGRVRRDESPIAHPQLLPLARRHTVFETVEQADITADQLKATKIGKVMRKIIGLSSVPLDDVHHFKSRAEALVNKWNQVQAGGSSSSDGAAKPTSSSAPAQDKTEAAAETNGNGADSSKVGAADATDVGDLTELKDDEPSSAPVNGSA